MYASVYSLSGPVEICDNDSGVFITLHLFSHVIQSQRDYEFSSHFSHTVNMYVNNVYFNKTDSFLRNSTELNFLQEYVNVKHALS